MILMWFVGDSNGYEGVTNVPIFDQDFDGIDFTRVSVGLDRLMIKKILI